MKATPINLRIIMFLVAAALLFYGFTSFAGQESFQYKLFFEGKEKTANLIRSENGILLAPLGDVIDMIDYSVIDDCGRCGHVSIASNDKNVAKTQGTVYIQWSDNTVTFDNGQTLVVKLDADNIISENITYTSLELYKHLGFSVEINDSDKSIRFSKQSPSDYRKPDTISDKSANVAPDSNKVIEKDKQDAVNNTVAKPDNPVPSVDNLKIQAGKPFIVYFYSPACSSCKKVSAFMDKLKKNYKDLVMIKYNISDIDSMKLLQLYGKEYGLAQPDIGVVPAAFISREPFIAENLTYENMETAVKDYKADHPTPLLDNSTGDTGTVKTKGGVVSLSTLLLAGLVNGINPCSLSMFLFLLALLVVERKNILKIGISFITGKMLMFFLLGTLFYRLLSVLEINWVSTLVKGILIFIILAFALLNINDFFAAKSKKYNRIKLQLPTSLRGLYQRLMKRFATYGNSKYLALIMALLGMFLSLGEFMCTGQIYLSSIVLLVQTGIQGLLPVLYLFLYSLAFTFPLFIITFLIYKGKKVFNLSEILLDRLPFIKIISTFVFVAFGLYIIFYT